MDGKKLKAVLYIKGIKTREWLNIAFEIVRGLYESRKEEQSQTT